MSAMVTMCKGGDTVATLITDETELKLLGARYAVNKLRTKCGILIDFEWLPLTTKEVQTRTGCDIKYLVNNGIIKKYGRGYKVI